MPIQSSYEYIGPAELARLVSPERIGRAIESPADLAAWIADRSPAESDEPFTFVIDFQQHLRLAARRSEHVVCAGGGRVLGAGEIGFEHGGDRWVVRYISNQSTGYCPDLDSWVAVAAALDRIGLAHPAGFTQQVIFRRCPECAEVNMVREEFFVCAFCENDLPTEWNIAEAGPRA